MQFFLKSFAGFIQKTGVAIGVTQMDISTQPTIDNYHQQLKELDMKIPVFSVDAREKKDVSILVQALMFSLDPGIEE
jgi:signal recognition particle receptor subunit beta